ncbi:MAG: hypothetical protein HYU78_13980 [Rhodocyclales bacterium]|nr:hypothetical protein [Rhodocyclales bacterium]
MNIDPARQYALKLHALSANDRNWILAQLPPDTQDRLRSLIGELEEIGLQVDQGLLDTLAMRGEEAPDDAGAGDAAHLRNVRLLDRADSRWIAAALKGEPAVVRSAIEGAHAWAWLSPVGADATAAVQATRPSMSPPRLGPSARVRAALVAQLARKMVADEQAGREDVRAIRQPAATTGDRAPLGGKWFAWRR